MNNLPVQLLNVFHKANLRRGSIFGMILVVALLAFEIFNYSTTDFALTDLLGKDLSFLGMRWATILSIAFCGIDFAGIARLFTPQKTAAEEPVEVWYLFGAWVLAASMNATLTWWGVAVAINNHTALGASIIGRETLMQGVPVFVSLMVWVIRILIIGTISIAGDRLFSMADDLPTRQPASRYERPVSNPQPAGVSARPVTRPQPTSMIRPAPKPEPTYEPALRQEPTYHPVGMAARPREEAPAKWRG